MSAMPQSVLEAASLVNSGFVWDIELKIGHRLGEAPVLALRDALLAAGTSYARATAVPLLELEFARLAEILMRIKPELVRANGCMLPLSPLGISSGAMAHLQVAAWPYLQAELERRGIIADGPGQRGVAEREARRTSRKGQTPLLRCRLFFDSALVGPDDSFSWVKKPAGTAIELGLASADGVTMAGIDYGESAGRAIRAWSAVLSHLEDACDAGGQPPIWIARPDGNVLPPEFLLMLQQATDEAIRATGVPEPETVVNDVRIAACTRAAVVCIGKRACGSLQGKAYARMVENLAVALRRVGIPAGAVFQAGYGLRMLEESVPQDVAYVVCPDVDLSVSRLIEVDQAKSREGDSESLNTEYRRFSVVPWGRLGPLSVSWLPEPGSPLFGRTPRPLEAAQLTVYATAEAPLPLSGARRGREWVELVLNGGRQGFQRAMQEVDQSDRIGAIAIARARTARYLRRPLPVRRRADLDTFRLRCSQRFAEFGRSASATQLGKVIAEVLVASVREPAVADDLLVAVAALLMNAGREPPLVLVLGARCTWLLRAPDRRPVWVDLAKSLVDDGHEEDLATIWSDHPLGLIPPKHVDDALSQLWNTAVFATDPTALAAFAGWALQDARERRMQGVRGADAYVSIAEPRLQEQTGFERAYFLRETETHVIVLVVGNDGGRILVRLPRSGEDWERWSSTAGGALLAAYLAGAYRDMVVPVDVTAFVEEVGAPIRPDAPSVQLQPVGYIPVHRRPRQPGGGESALDRLHPAPHQVTWYVRRLPLGHRANPEALGRAARLGMRVPAGYTFVDTYLWPRASDPRSVATALRATLAMSSLRALLQSNAEPRPDSTSVADQLSDDWPPQISMTDASALAGEASATGAVVPPPSERPHRRWWAFWQRGRG